VPFLALYIIYWGCQSQMSTTWYNQGCQMNLKLGRCSLSLALARYRLVCVFLPTSSNLWAFAGCGGGCE
jgi:hypothetical protein